MPYAKNTRKTIVLDFENNLICKNCGVTTAVLFINLRPAIDLFMRQHKDCKHGDDVITLNQIANIIGISEKNFRNYTTKINMPASLPYQKSYGRKLLFNRVEINQWLENNDVLKTIRAIRADAKDRKKPYVPRGVKKQVQQQKVEKSLSLMSRFIRGEFDTSRRQIERRAKIEAAKANRPARLVLACIETDDGDLVRQFI